MSHHVSRFSDINSRSHGFVLYDTRGRFVIVTGDREKPSIYEEDLTFYQARGDPSKDDVCITTQEGEYPDNRSIMTIFTTDPERRFMTGPYLIEPPMRGGPVFFRFWRFRLDPPTLSIPMAAILTRHDGESGGDVTILDHWDFQVTMPEVLRPYATSGKTVALVSSLYAVTGINSDKTTFTFGGPYYGGYDGGAEGTSTTSAYLNGKPIV